MKKVLLEAEKLNDPESGLGQFCDHLIKAILQEELDGLDISLYIPAHKVGHYGDKAKYIKHSDIHKWIRPFKNSFDVWHCLHQDSVFLPGKETKLILTVHDMNFLQKYEGRKKEWRRAKLQDKVDRADVLVAISNFTRDQLYDELDLRGRRVEVIYNGLTIDLSLACKEEINIGKPFLFFIGAVTARKNIGVLVPMMEYLPDLSLVIAGDKESEYAQTVLQQVNELGLKDRVLFTGRINDSQRISLYRNCTALVFPSLAEGFGLPVIEAMSFGKPVFLSNFGSLPEVGADLARYFPDFHPEVMAHTIHEGLQEFATGSWSAEQLKTHALSFSWKNAAKRYLEIYRSS